MRRVRVRAFSERLRSSWRRRVEGSLACGELSFLLDVAGPLSGASGGETGLDTEEERRARGAVLGALATFRKDPSEIDAYIYMELLFGPPEPGASLAAGRRSASLTSRPYREPHPDSEVRSLWSVEQCGQGKSAKWMRNFGRSIGSKGRMQAGRRRAAWERATAWRLRERSFGCCPALGLRGLDARARAGRRWVFLSL